MATKFLYMDEQYIDPRTFRGGGHSQQRRAHVSLTGLLITTGHHREFRRRFYAALATAMNVEENAVPSLPVIHASSLFPDRPDDAKIAFLDDLVSICVDLDFRIYRVGYYRTAQMMQLFRTQTAILGLCFAGMLGCISGELVDNEIWPVMETDNSPDQDRQFAGLIQNVDYLTAFLGGANVTIDNTNLGELHYSTKRSSYGAVTDCMAYLLDAKNIAVSGMRLSPYKQRIADLAIRLETIVMVDEVIEMTFNAAR